MHDDKTKARLFISISFAAIAIVSATGGFMLALAVVERPYPRYQFKLIKDGSLVRYNTVTGGVWVRNNKTMSWSNISVPASR